MEEEGRGEKKGGFQPGQIGAYSNLYWHELKDYVITESELWATLYPFRYIDPAATAKTNRGRYPPFYRETLLTRRDSRPRRHSNDYTHGPLALYFAGIKRETSMCYFPSDLYLPVRLPGKLKTN